MTITNKGSNSSQELDAGMAGVVKALAANPAHIWWTHYELQCASGVLNIKRVMEHMEASGWTIERRLRWRGSGTYDFKLTRNQTC